MNSQFVFVKNPERARLIQSAQNRDLVMETTSDIMECDSELLYEMLTRKRAIFETD